MSHEKNCKVRLSMNWKYELTSTEPMTESQADEFAMYLRDRVGSACTVSIVREKVSEYGMGIGKTIREDERQQCVKALKYLGTRRYMSQEQRLAVNDAAEEIERGLKIILGHPIVDEAVQDKSDAERSGNG